MGDDVLGMALTAPMPGQPLLVERSDGHTSVTDLAWWLRSPEARPPTDVGALKWVRSGLVLDVGCCTGRHLELLADSGVAGYGIDTCAAAIGLARDAGVACEQADAWTYRPAQAVDWVLTLGGNLGIAGSLGKLPRFLGRLAAWLAPGGALVVSSVDWRRSALQHRGWIASRQAQGRYPGETRLRLRYGLQAGDWFDWLLVDPDALQESCADLGLSVAGLERWGNKYAALLRREQR